MTNKKAPSPSAMDKLLDVVNWEDVPAPGPGASAEPYVTMQGILDLPSAGLKVRCYQLSNGIRILNKEDLDKFFGTDVAKLLGIKT